MPARAGRLAAAGPG